MSPKVANAIVPEFASDTPAETLLIELSASLSEAATSAIHLSTDGRISLSAQNAFWSLGQQSLELAIRIDSLWYEILKKSSIDEIRRHRDIGAAASEASAAAESRPSGPSLLRAYGAVGGANEAIRAWLDRIAAS